MAKREFAQAFGPGLPPDPSMAVYQSLGLALPMDAHGHAHGQPAKFAKGAGPIAVGWTCPACGNTNFPDREVCNMRKCAQPRPQEAVQLMRAGVPVHAQGAMPMHMQVPMHAQGHVMMVPMQPMQQMQQMQPMQPMQPMRPIPAAQGGWTCVKCQNMNFADREFCNMRKCGAPRSDSLAQGSFLPLRHVEASPHLPPGTTRTPDPEGGWTCEKCNCVNFADRETCFMRKCGAVRPGLEGLVSPRGPPEAPSQVPPQYSSGAGSDAGDFGGDWECDACGNSNFGDRAFCNMRKCQQIRPLADWVCVCGNKNYSDRMVCNMRKCAAQRQDMHPKAVAALAAMGKGLGRAGGGGMSPQGVHGAPGQPLMLAAGMPHLMGLHAMYGGQA